LFIALTPPMSGSLFRIFRLLSLALLCSVFAAHADDLGDVQGLYYAGQPEQALQRADDYLAKHPKDAPMRFIKGVMLSDAKRDAEAIALFQSISEDYPDLAEPYNNLAVLYAAGGDYARARAALEQALRANPTYVTAQENLGDVYAALAVQAYAKVLKLEPGNTTVPPKLAVVRSLYKHGERAAANIAPSPSKPGVSP
jgi:tetratricopeptide (TPR) repeat protein